MADQTSDEPIAISNASLTQTESNPQPSIPPEPIPDPIVPSPVKPSSPTQPSTDVVEAILNNSSTVVHSTPPPASIPSPAEPTPPPAPIDANPKKRSAIPLLVGLLLLVGSVVGGAFLVTKQSSIADTRGKASGTMYFFNTQTTSCQSTTAHTNLQTCAANLTLTWPTKFGGTCYDTLDSCTSANSGGGGGGGGGGGATCQPKVYFNTVATDANGDNAGTCKVTTKTFDSSLVACDGSGQTCNQYLDQLTQQTGITKVFDGCFSDMASCQRPNGKTVSFRFFYDTVTKKCISTNHRYDSQDIDVDDVNHYTCLKSLDMYQPNARKVCYTSKPTCLSDNAITISPTSPSPICTNIKVYKANVQITPSTLLSGDVVTIAVVGTGDPTKARFRVNGEQITADTDNDPNWTISTTKNASGEYEVSYTIPTGVTSFLFEGETFAQGAWH